MTLHLVLKCPWLAAHFIFLIWSFRSFPIFNSNWRCSDWLLRSLVSNGSYSGNVIYGRPISPQNLNFYTFYRWWLARTIVWKSWIGAKAWKTSTWKRKEQSAQEKNLLENAGLSQTFHCTLANAFWSETIWKNVPYLELRKKSINQAIRLIRSRLVKFFPKPVKSKAKKPIGINFLLNNGPNLSSLASQNKRRDTIVCYRQLLLPFWFIRSSVWTSYHDQVPSSIQLQVQDMCYRVSDFS